MVKLTGEQTLIVVGVVGALALAWYAQRKVGQVAAAAVPLVNPFDERNLAYTSTNSFLSLLTGNKDYSTGKASLGTLAYDVSHDGTFNPTSTNNFIYRNIGDENNTIGTKIYDGVQWVKGLW